MHVLHAVMLCEVSPLQHEAFDHTVKSGALVAQRCSTSAGASLARAQLPEVLRSLLAHKALRDWANELGAERRCYKTAERN